MSDKPVGLDDGADVAEFLRLVDGKEYECLGTCRSTFTAYASSFVAYPHDGGLLDKNGARWWVYYACPKCGYETSFRKFPSRAVPRV